jgi:hypothetical protein
LDKFYKLKGSVGLEGAYDVSGVTYEFLIKPVGRILRKNDFNIKYQVLTNAAKPALTNEVLASYLAYSVKEEGRLSSY